MYNAPLGYEIDSFKLGWDNTAKPGTMQKGSFKEIKNFNITRHRGIEKRGGMTPLYASPAGSDKITSFYEYNAPDGNAYLLTALGTKIRAFYEAAWHDLKTELTADKKYSFATHLGLCYGVNGVDPNFKLHNDTPYQVGITPPADAPAIAKISPGTDAKTEEYTETNQDNCGELGQHADRTRLAQTFILIRDTEFTKIKLKLKKVGTITAGKKVWVEIHSDKVGTQVGGDSDTQEANDIATSFTTYELAFSGTKPDLDKNIDHYMVICGDFDVSSTNFVVVGFDQSAPTYNSTRKYWEISNGMWTGHTAIDLVFEIHGYQKDADIELLNPGIAVDTGFSQKLRVGVDPYEESNDYLIAQSFKLVTAADLNSVRIPLKKFGSIWYEEKVWVEIHSSLTGTSETKNASANIVGQASDDVSIKDDLDDSDFGWITFNFTGTKPSLSSATTYYIVLYTDHYIDDIYYVRWTRSEINVYHPDGMRHKCDYADETLGTWGNVSTSDHAFKIYGSTTSEQQAEGSYSLDYLDDIKNLRETTAQTLMAQSLEVIEESTVTRVKLWLAKVGSPTGNIWVEIHDGREGTSGTGGSSTYIVGEKSANVDIATGVTGAFPTYEWVEFTFSGIEPPLEEGRTYYIVVYASNVINGTSYVSVGMDKIDPQYADGKTWNVDNSSPMEWTEFDYIDLIFELYQTVGGLTGKYKHKYCYKRTAFADLISNPSEGGDSTEPANQNLRVTLVASDDPQVNKIILYRTLDFSGAGEDDEDPLYYKVKELENEDQNYDDVFSDGALTTLLKEDNTIPPKAKFVVLHKDRVFYINCPDEESGGQLAMWSKSGKGEACPSLNYQYFDRDDGEEIVGAVSHRDNLLIFKRNKIGILSGNLSDPLSCEIEYLSLGIGCIASWAILPLEDKVLFLSEEGWKATDGTNIYNISSKINGLIGDGYISIKENENYSVAYYPEKEQFQFLMNHSTLDPMITVGHFIIPLMLASKGIMGISEKVLGDMVGWTYHQYAYHTLTCLGNYTDSDGIMRVIAGSNDGYVYLLDSGLTDDGSSIQTRLRTDWLALGRPKSHTKVTRQGYLGYCTSGVISLGIQEDIDFIVGGDPTILTGSTRGIDDALHESFNLAGRGELFRYTLSEVSSQSLDINVLAFRFRDLGAR